MSKQFYIKVYTIDNYNQDKEQWYLAYDSREYEEIYDYSSFKELQREHGKCVGKAYRDKVENPCLDYEFLGLEREYVTHEVGYVFQKKQKYEDCNEYYMEETWIEFIK